MADTSEAADATVAEKVAAKMAAKVAAKVEEAPKAKSGGLPITKY